MPTPPRKQHRVLCVCDHGNNRSVHFAHPLKYWGNDVLACGLNNDQSTLDLLFSWADLIILTEERQRALWMQPFHQKIVVYDVGPDCYPRPFNPVLHSKVKRILDQHQDVLKHM